MNANIGTWARPHASLWTHRVNEHDFSVATAEVGRQLGCDAKRVAQLRFAGAELSENFRYWHWFNTAACAQKNNKIMLNVDALKV